jgi:hypothetical protein
MVTAISCVPAGAGDQLSAGATLAPLQVYRGSIGAPSRQGAVTVRTTDAVVLVVVAAALVEVEPAAPVVADRSVATVSKKSPSPVGSGCVVGAADVLTLPSWPGWAGRISRPS